MITQKWYKRMNDNGNRIKVAVYFDLNGAIIASILALTGERGKVLEKKQDVNLKMSGFKYEKNYTEIQLTDNLLLNGKICRYDFDPQRGTRIVFDLNRYFCLNHLMFQI